jgi:hypothetical protein
VCGGVFLLGISGVHMIPRPTWVPFLFNDLENH